MPKPKDESNPMIIRDQNKCVLCGRCVRGCLEVQVNGVIDVAARGSDSFITTFNHTSLKDSNCVFCGQCVQACPVGALTSKKAKAQGRPWEVRRSAPPVPIAAWAVSCGSMSKTTRLSMSPALSDGAPNEGRLCVKGRFGYDWIYLRTVSRLL